MPVEDIEAIRTSPAKRVKFARIIVVGLAFLVVSRTIRFLRDEARPLVDFDVFYIVAHMVWRGDIEHAYRFVTMAQAQAEFSGRMAFMPWTYPPQFDLLVAPLAFFSLGGAYFLFVTITLSLYLLILRKIAGNGFPLVLILIFPAMAITIGCGQNGFLTGGLIGLTCLAFQKRPLLAGVPLGLMIIKPHLAVALGFHTLVSQRWVAAAVAVLIVAGTSVIATHLLGAGVWVALVDGTREARVFLTEGMYPLHRMISPYAALRSLGVPAGIGVTFQVLVAIWTLWLIYAAHARLPFRQSLGVAAIGSLLISPYAYDYDLPIYGIGVAILLPDIIRSGTSGERALFYSLSFLAGLIGPVTSFWLEVTEGSIASLAERPSAPTIAGLMLIANLALVWRVLKRDQMKSNA